MGQEPVTQLEGVHCCSHKVAVLPLKNKFASMEARDFWGFGCMCFHKREKMEVVRTQALTLSLSLNKTATNPCEGIWCVNIATFITLTSPFPSAYSCNDNTIAKHNKWLKSIWTGQNHCFLPARMVFYRFRWFLTSFWRIVVGLKCQSKAWVSVEERSHRLLRPALNEMKETLWACLFAL